jgi:hypothetical protein
MSAPRDLDRLIQSFLVDGPLELPEPSYNQVRDRMEKTRQRAFIGPWRTSDVSNLLKIGLAAAAVVVIAVVAFNLLPGSSAPGGEPSATPEPTATPEPSPSPTASAPPLTQSFTSTLHGFSVSYPEGWTAQAATEPWTDRAFPLNFLVPQVDFLYDPTLKADLFLAIASQPIGDSTPDDWVAEQMASNEGCTATEPTAVDGATGLIGADGCNVAVVTTAGRGYWIQLYTSGDDPLAVAPYDRAWFEEVLATVQLLPEDAVDSGASPSP